MTLPSKSQIENLHNIHQPYCISINIPTHRAGNEVLQKQDILALKNQIKLVTKKLEAHGLTNLEIKNRLEPIKKMILDTEFWRHQSDGLAIFLGRNIFEVFRLPIHFEDFNFVGETFYLKSLLPIFSGDGNFYLLALDLENVNLFECSRYTINKLDTKDILPAQMEEVVGFEYEQKNLQIRSQRKGQATYHDAGSANEDRKNEIKRFFKAINKGLKKRLNRQDIPMLVASQEYLFPMYKDVNTYKELLSKPIRCNPSSLNIFALQELAWEAVKPIFDQERMDKITQFKANQDTDKTSSLLEDILQASMHGKIDALFCEKREDFPGVFDPLKGKVTLYDSEHTPNFSLMNLAAMQTFMNGGKVYLLENEEMPNPYAKINALFRF
jgi:hypothetical protein